MVSREKLEILKYIIDRKAISIELFKKILNVSDLKDMTIVQAYALEELLGMM